MVRLVRIPLPSPAVPPSCVLCSSLAVAASHFVRAFNNRLQNEHAPILYTVILLREHGLILHSAYVILSEHELLFSEHVIPLSEHVIPHSARVILLSEHRLILHGAYVILSEHKLLFSEHVMPHSEQVIPLSEHGPQNARISSSLP